MLREEGKTSKNSQAGPVPSVLQTAFAGEIQLTTGQSITANNISILASGWDGEEEGGMQKVEWITKGAGYQIFNFQKFWEAVSIQHLGSALSHRRLQMI